MTKRYGNFEGFNSKKQKIEEDLDHLWGDDLDDDALDDCIKLASQVCDKTEIRFSQKANDSILPSYNGFKVPNMFCSTQLNLSCIATTSKETKEINFEQEYLELSQKCNDKDGEVSILRSQLREAKTAVQVQQQKTQNEWRDKLKATDKELKTIKTELEFKNLEIVNLKQKLGEMSKQRFLDSSINGTTFRTPQKTKIESPKLDIEENCPKNRKQIVLAPHYPLKSVVISSIFTNSCEEKMSTDPTLSNTLSYLHTERLNSDDVNKNSLKFKSVLNDKQELSFKYIYPELLHLINSTDESLNSDEQINNVNKIICVSIQFLEDFCLYLTELQKITGIDNIQQADLVYLDEKLDENCDDTNTFDENECGINAGQSLNVIAELLEYNSFLQNFICGNKSPIFNESYVDNFPCMNNRTKFMGQYFFLNLILKILILIGQLRKAHVASYFLAAVLRLMTNICKIKEVENILEIFCKIMKEIIFSRPRKKVIFRITHLLKLASHNKNFVKDLFKPNNKKVKSDSKKGIVYFDDDCCRFYMFTFMLRNHLLKMNVEDLPLNVCINMLSFIYNTYKDNLSIYQDVVGCECLPKLYKLEIDIVCKALEKYKELKKRNNVPDAWKTFFKDKMFEKVLQLILLNSYDQIEKYVDISSQFKDFENKLCDMDDCDTIFENLQIDEEIPIIPSHDFEGVDFL